MFAGLCKVCTLAVNKDNHFLKCQSLQLQPAAELEALHKQIVLEKVNTLQSLGCPASCLHKSSFLHRRCYASKFCADWSPKQKATFWRRALLLLRSRFKQRESKIIPKCQFVSKNRNRADYWYGTLKKHSKKISSFSLWPAMQRDKARVARQAVFVRGTKAALEWGFAVFAIKGEVLLEQVFFLLKQAVSSIIIATIWHQTQGKREAVQASALERLVWYMC